jgi:hypothetical protein
MPITVHLKGGVGNQLFCLSTGYYLAKKKNTSFFITQDDFEGCNQGRHPSTYYSNLYARITKYKTNLPIFNHKEKQWLYYDLVPHFIQVDTEKYIINLDGYFQSAKYFPDMHEQLKELYASNKYVNDFLTSRGYKDRFPELFNPHTYCFIGVRRGDYIPRAAFHNPCGMDYYNKALERCYAKKYYIASDDMDWCRRKFIGPQYVFLDIKDDLELLYLGTLFPKYIISNSSYHWWMSYLSAYQDPLVIAPDKWLFGPEAPRSAYDSIYRDSMIVIERTIETD